MGKIVAYLGSDGMAYYSLLYSNDPDLEKVADAWKEAENPIKKYLKNSKVLKD